MHFHAFDCFETIYSIPNTTPLHPNVKKESKTSFNLEIKKTARRSTAKFFGLQMFFVLHFLVFVRPSKFQKLGRPPGLTTKNQFIQPCDFIQAPNASTHWSLGLPCFTTPKPWPPFSYRCSSTGLPAAFHLVKIWVLCF